MTMRQNQRVAGSGSRNLLTHSGSAYIFELMTRRLAIILMLISFAGGVLSGAPMHASSGKMMKCCDKAKSKDATRIADGSRLCCAVNCSESAPAAPGISGNFAPAIMATMPVKGPIGDLYPVNVFRVPTSVVFARDEIPVRIQPKFLQHNSFLI